MEGISRQLQEVSGQNEQLVTRLAMLERAAAAAPLPTPQARQAALVDTRLVKQPNTFEGDKENWADWAFTFRAYAAAVSTDIAKVLAHAEIQDKPCGQFGEEAGVQATAQLYYILVMLMKGAAMKKARTAIAGHGAEVWRLLCLEYEPKQRRRFQAMLANVLRARLPEPLGESLDAFERQVKQYEDQSTTKIADSVLAASLLAGIESPTISQHLALNEGTLDTYPKIVEALRAYLSASRGWSVGANGQDTMEVDALQKGKWKGKGTRCGPQVVATRRKHVCASGDFK